MDRCFGLEIRGRYVCGCVWSGRRSTVRTTTTRRLNILLTLAIVAIVRSAFVPRPVYAILMLFPVTERYEETRKARDAELKDHTDLDHLLFFKQTVSKL